MSELKFEKFTKSKFQFTWQINFLKILQNKNKLFTCQMSKLKYLQSKKKK